jgi:hypothetical protein
VKWHNRTHNIKDVKSPGEKARIWATASRQAHLSELWMPFAHVALRLISIGTSRTNCGRAMSTQRWHRSARDELQDTNNEPSFGSMDSHTITIGAFSHATVRRTLRSSATRHTQVPESTWSWRSHALSIRLRHRTMRRPSGTPVARRTLGAWRGAFSGGGSPSASRSLSSRAGSSAWDRRSPQSGIDGHLARRTCYMNYKVVKRGRKAEVRDSLAIDLTSRNICI